ncbi:hypothetical protein K493DRAFT_290882 [Basidiobolus meristosporus CBS 931.73]|uniref:Amino acid transporter transmembrane domain-containing protein n=1 Tax=Basidiobolus meristosporus CBS 931.73 TaxID=1314790 RepID=A0A1Y1XQ32_9FUNG|nr:hypothetical protein K493DRAFT_290882 [Basidiobolus meristosporus CBS 931.73]|eukprot:ORX87841.1 hypothetical protein K493DRAFT_290882 [Basidiobolus meristosporus CBS 931.73]
MNTLHLDSTKRVGRDNGYVVLHELHEDAEGEYGELDVPLELNENKRTGSNFGAYFNVVCVIAGTGTLQIPFALQQAGWLGIILIFLGAAVATYTGILLIKCLYYKGGDRLDGFPAIGEAAFGKFGRMLVNVFYYSILVGGACVYLVLSGINIDQIASARGSTISLTTWIAIAALIIWVPFVACKSLKEVAILAIFGAVATGIVVVVTVVVGLEDLHQPKSAPITHNILVISNIPIALGSIGFSFGGNVIYPHVEETMKNPRAWPKVIIAAMSTCCAMYIIIGIVGYRVYGNTTVSPILLNLPTGFATTLATILITLHVIVAAPIYLTSCALELETILKIDRKYHTARNEFLLRFVLRTAMMIVLIAVGMTVPFVDDLMSLIGALATCMVLFILPIVFYWKLFGFKVMGKLETAWCVFIILFGIIGCVFGTLAAFRKLMEDFAAHS